MAAAAATAAARLRAATMAARGMSTTTTTGAATGAAAGAEKHTAGLLLSSTTAGIGNGGLAACPGSAAQLHQLRAEALAGCRRLWDGHSVLARDKGLLREETGALLLEMQKKNAVAKAAAAKGTLKILLAGGGFLFALVYAFHPVVKSAWQADTVAAMERKFIKAKTTAATAPSSPSAASST